MFLKSICILGLILEYSTDLVSQGLWQKNEKRSISSKNLGTWQAVESPKICRNGKYVCYTINVPEVSDTIVVQSTRGNKIQKIPVAGSHNTLFTEDNRNVVSLLPKDSLLIFSLSEWALSYITNVSSYKTPLRGSGAWIGYQLKNEKKDFILRNLHAGTEQRFSSVNEYYFSEDGTMLLLQVKSDNNKVVLKLVNLASGKDKIVWEGRNATHFVFDFQCKQLVFLSEESNYNRVGRAIYYYRIGDSSAVTIVKSQYPDIDSNQVIANSRPNFSKDGEFIFFKANLLSKTNYTSSEVKVDIWRYNDTQLQSEFINKYQPLINYAYKVNDSNHRTIRLTNENEQILSNTNDSRKYILVGKQIGYNGERNWRTSAQQQLFIVETSTGLNKLIDTDVLRSGALSPDDKYVLYYDRKQRHYFSYNTYTGESKNVTERIKFPVYNEQWDNPDFPPPFPIAAWVLNEDKVLLYDQYDIWKVDLSGLVEPENITNGYGRNNSIVFRLADLNMNIVKNGYRLILAAFNTESKDNGFFAKNLARKGDPELLNMGKYLFHWLQVTPFSPLKAKDANAFIVRKMSASQSPNLYFTNDFVKFRPLSSVYPEKDYNWVTTELHTWKTFDGSKSQGILYKPENFNPEKKYPIIFYFYERLSDRLHEFIKPEACYGPINIPYFVSNGYLVFTPDIHYKVGEPGESAYNHVVSAAVYFSEKTWIDSKKMAIQGHSYGGYEVNYIITRTNLFAAAAEAAGVSDLISGYGGLVGPPAPGFSRQAGYELGQGRIGATLWDSLDLYIKNSPVIRAQHVTTPLLIMHNKNDGSVPWMQGIEFFTALRRLGKKAWLLQYDDGDHSVDGKAADDYTMRLTQFFNYYLKDYPKPGWLEKKPE